MNMFDRLPDECSACLKSFDKKDKEMVKSWHVVVKNDENVVRLYCTSCWKTATSVVEDFESSKK